MKVFGFLVTTFLFVSLASASDRTEISNAIAQALLGHVPTQDGNYTVEGNDCQVVLEIEHGSPWPPIAEDTTAFVNSFYLRGIKDGKEKVFLQPYTVHSDTVKIEKSNATTSISFNSYAACSAGIFGAGSCSEYEIKINISPTEIEFSTNLLGLSLFPETWEKKFSCSRK